MKVFLDTTVLVAAFATRGLCARVLGDEDLLSVTDDSVIRIASPRAVWELLRSGTR